MIVRRIPLFFCLALLASPALWAGEGPRIEFVGGKKHDFGTIVVGTVYRYAYRFKNAGDETLFIRKVKSGCACTASLAGDREIAPGGEGDVQIVFDSDGRLGHQDVQVFILTNDPKERDLERPNQTVLTLAGKVESLFDAMPPTAYFESFVAGKPRTRKVSIFPRTEGAVLANPIVKIPQDFIVVSSKSVEQGGKKGLELEVTITEQAPPGRLEEMILVETGFPGQPIVKVPVIASLLHEVIAYPDQLPFYLVRKGEGPVERTVTLERLEGTGGIPIRSVEADARYFEVKIEPVIPDKRVEIQFILKPAAPAGFFSQEVAILLDDARSPFLTVQIFGTIEPDIYASSPAIFFEPRTGGFPAVVGRLEVRRRQPLPFQVAEVTVEPITALAVERASQPAQGDPPSLLILQTGRLEGPGRAVLRIRTDVPGEEELDIHIFWK